MSFFKSFLSRFSNQDSVVEKDEYFQLTNRLESFKSILDAFNEIRNIIEENSENLEDEYIYRQVFEDENFLLSAKAKLLINDYDNAIMKESDSHSYTGSGTSGHSSAPVQPNTENPLSNVRLPTIELPKFSGDYNNWPEFRDTFESLIHSNNNIGSAKQIIDSLEFSEENYNVAWDLVCSRYNSKRLLAYNHIKVIHDIPHVSHESSLNLRKLAESATKHLRALLNLGQPTDSWDTLIIYTFTKKLDKASFKEWEKFRGSSDLPTLEDFKSFLRNRADLLETFDISQGENQSQKPKPAHGIFPHKTSLSLLLHKLQKIPGPSYKRPNFENKGIETLSNCLRANHNTSECVGGTCKSCNRKHNSLLHLGQNSSSVTPSVVEREVSNSQEQNLDEEPQSTTVNMSNQSRTETNTEVLLSTALVFVKDTNNRYQPCRVLLDSGSISHFITNSCCEKLGLKKLPIKMTVNRIGQATSSVTERCVLHLKSYNTSFYTTLSCLVISSINVNIPMQQLNHTVLKIPEHIHLVDPEFYKSSCIDILLGATIFWTLINSGLIILGKDMPILQSTSLGYSVRQDLSRYS
nr:unnamed protein product [Callosobruchus analis]